MGVGREALTLGLALGIAASRFLKASSTQRYEQRRTQSFTSNGVGNGQSPALGNPASYGRETTPIDAGSSTGVPTTSPGDASSGFGTTPPPPSGGTQGR